MAESEVKAVKTIEVVVKDGLCTGCGTCAGLCPNGSLEMIIDHQKGIYAPRLDVVKCNKCGVCYDICPGHSVDFNVLNREIFGRDPEDTLLGNSLQCYTGYAADYEIRYNSASGGLVTALLIFALEEKLIDGVLVTRMREDRPLEPGSFIARTKEEIISASKSKYCPVPANVALQEIMNAKEGERFAAVGLPCHIHGIRKAERVNKKLKERLKYKFGIFCNHTPSFLGTEYLLWKNNIKKTEVIKLDYRDEGWPGGVSIDLYNGNRYFLPHFNVWTIFGPFFFLTRCTCCYDQCADLADISFGDAWLQDFTGDEAGTSIIVCRSEAGRELLQNALSKGRITLNETTGHKVLQSQAGLYFRKKAFSARLSLLKLTRHRLPKYGVKYFNSTPRSLLKSLMLYFNIFISSKRGLWKLLSIYISLRLLIIKILSRLGFRKQ